MAENRRTCFFEGKCLLIAWTWERGREGGRERSRGHYKRSRSERIHIQMEEKEEV